MHYEDGTPVELGDVCVTKGCCGSEEIVGTVVLRSSGSDTCNITIQTVPVEGKMSGRHYPSFALCTNEGEGERYFFCNTITATAKESRLLWRRPKPAPEPGPVGASG